MIYFVSLICGVLNGLFAAAAGQLMIFYLVFILKKEAHISRATSIFCMAVTTIITLFGYLKYMKFKIHEFIIVVITGFVFGSIGAKLMNKINANLLNLLSGLLIFGVSIYNLFFK